MSCGAKGRAAPLVDFDACHPKCFRKINMCRPRRKVDDVEQSAIVDDLASAAFLSDAFQTVGGACAAGGRSP